MVLDSVRGRGWGRVGLEVRSPKTHELKTWLTFFDAVLSGIKLFELRWNDRDYRVGDELHLREYDPDAGYTGRYVRARVVYMIRGPILGLAEGWVVMSIQVFERGTE